MLESTIRGVGAPACLAGGCERQFFPHPVQDRAVRILRFARELRLSGNFSPGGGVTNRDVRTRRDRRERQSSFAVAMADWYFRRWRSSMSRRICNFPAQSGGLRAACYLALCGWTVAAAGTVHAEPEPAPEASQPVQDHAVLYDRGQRAFEREDFAGAAQTWMQLYLLLPQDEDAGATRRMVMLNIVSAHMEASLRDRTRARNHLSSAAELLDSYVGTVDGATDHDEVARALARVRKRLAGIQAANPQPSLRMDIDESLAATQADATPPEPPPGIRGDDGSSRLAAPNKAAETTLMVLGPTAVALGLGASSFIVIGAIDLSTAGGKPPSTIRDRHVRMAQAAVIGGSISGVALLAGGVFMWIKGLLMHRDRRDQQARSPVTWTPMWTTNGAVGIRLSGDF